jgi:hypothetical protein
MRRISVAAKNATLGPAPATSLPIDLDGWRYVDYFSPKHAEEFDDLVDGLARHYEALHQLIDRHKATTSASLGGKYGWLAGKLKTVSG